MARTILLSHAFGKRPPALASMSAATVCIVSQRSPTSTSRRLFSHSGKFNLRSTELTPDHYSSLRANSSRLWSDIHATASKFGTGRRYGDGPEQTGLSRLTLTDSDKQARDWFVTTTESLGCKVTIDSVGNIFAARPGLNDRIPATFVGSHLDSQPLGGRFDGVLGVVAGIEMLRVLNENWIETEGPVGVVNWTNEEGARFPVSMMGSGVWAGTQSQETIHELKEVSAGEDGKPKTVKEELARIGYLGTTPAGLIDGGVKMAGHFELHIEQGPNLDSSGKSVAVVEGVQAYKWFEVTVRGRACHAGTTPMNKRADALRVASALINTLPTLAEQRDVLVTVGIIRSEPQSVNTVPDRVTFTVDVRHKSDAALDDFVDNCIAKVVREERDNVNRESKDTGAPPIEIEIKEIFSSRATNFNKVAIDCVEHSARMVMGEDEVPRLISGAGHDSVNTAKHCPTAMVFASCKNGVSHHPEEWTDEEHCAVGTNVIIQSVLRFDKQRYEQEY